MNLHILIFNKLSTDCQFVYIYFPIVSITYNINQITYICAKNCFLLYAVFFMEKFLAVSEVVIKNSPCNQLSRNDFCIRLYYL